MPQTIYVPTRPITTKHHINCAASMAIDAKEAGKALYIKSHARPVETQLIHELISQLQRRLGACSLDVQVEGLRLPLDPVLSAILVICLLLALAKILSQLFPKIRLPGVVGEILAGVILGPYVVGAIMFEGKPLIELGPLVSVFAYFGMIIALFRAGLETTFAEFKAAGVKPFAMAGVGAAVPFAAGFYISSFLGFPQETGMIVGLALAQDSVVVIIRILEELKMMQLRDAKMIVSLAVVADAMSLSLLTLVISMTVAQIPITVGRVTVTFARSLMIWLVLVAGLALLIPYLVRKVRALEKEGVIETAATVTCFGSAALSVVVGLSPLVGAFAAGMGLAGSKAIKRVREYIEKISLIFIPVLFASMGARMDLASFLAGSEILVIVAVFFVTELVTKLIGYGFLASYVLEDRMAGLRVGLAMTCMGEEGMLVLTIGLSHSLISTSIYTGMMLVSLLTTIITPLILRPLYARIEFSNLKETKPNERLQISQDLYPEEVCCSLRSGWVSADHDYSASSAGDRACARSDLCGGEYL